MQSRRISARWAVVGIMAMMALPGSSSAVVVDGTWDASAQAGSCIYSGQGTLIQSGASFTGNATLSLVSGGGLCFSQLDGAVASGSIFGSDVSFSFPEETGFDFTGTVSVDSLTMSGTFSDGLIGGSWSATRVQTCGDGVTQTPEACDDGNTVGGDCCDGSCQQEPTNTPCTSDGNPCTLDTCCSDALCSLLVPLGCNHIPDLDGTSCTDGLFCNGAEECQNGMCQNGAEACTPLGCDEAADECSCPASILPDCRTADKSLLLLKQTEDSRDKLLWKWINGEATSINEFGDPTTDADYLMCIYTGPTQTLLTGGAIHIADGAGWEGTSTGWKYGDSGAAQDGVHKTLLKGSLENRSKILVKGKGTALPDPALPIPPADLPLIVQLVNDDTPVCWESTFGPSDVLVDSLEQFKAKTD